MFRNPTSTAKYQIARADVMIWVRTRDLTVMCEFNFNDLSLYLRQKKNIISNKLSKINVQISFL